MTGNQISEIVEHIFMIRTLDKDLFKCVMFLNSLNGPQYEPVQAQISHGLADSTKDAPYTFDNIQKLLKTVQNLTNLKSPATGLFTDTVLAAMTHGRFRSSKPFLPGHTHPAGARCCTTCLTQGRSCGGHEAPYCAHPGGAMEKQGIEAA
ncbi:hypothetical protein C0995_014764 [Termitomyces sp. Mi166|nr:hypothetical protein C0995_014764 [Termitomyces sp. Mi166\